MRSGTLWSLWWLERSTVQELMISGEPWKQQTWMMMFDHYHCIIFHCFILPGWSINRIIPTGHLFSYFFYFFPSNPGVERLSSITLNNPEHINVTESVSQPLNSALSSHTDSSKAKKVSQEENKDETFSVPSQLKQHFIITPCKLRLVTLAGLILWKCKVSSCCVKLILLCTCVVWFIHHKWRPLYRSNY